MADLHLEQRYDESTRQFLGRFTEVANQIQDLDSKQAANFFMQGLVNWSLVHEIFIETPLQDMNEVGSKAEGIFHVEEKQRIAKSAAIAVAQNNASNKSPKHYEAKGKLEEINSSRHGG